MQNTKSHLPEISAVMLCPCVAPHISSGAGTDSLLLQLFERHHQQEESCPFLNTVDEGRDVHIGGELLPVLPLERRGVRMYRRAHPFLHDCPPGQVLVLFKCQCCKRLHVCSMLDSDTVQDLHMLTQRELPNTAFIRTHNRISAHITYIVNRVFNDE